MEPFRITGISAQGVKMNRLPVTPAEEAQVRSALAQMKDLNGTDAIKEYMNEHEEQQRVYPSGYRVNCAPWSGIPGGQDTVQRGAEMEHEPIRRLEDEGQRKRKGHS